MRSIVTRTIATAAVAAALASPALAQDRQPGMRPPVGGVQSPIDVMIFYVARTCTGGNCSEWIVAEGVVQWDTHKRLFAFLDRNAGRKLPVVIDTWGQSNFNVAASLGRILRERQYETTVGMTKVTACAGKPEEVCFDMKRKGEPLDATLGYAPACDVACVLMLAGGVRRGVPPATKVVISGMAVRNRLGLSVSDEHQEGLTAVYSDQFRRYFTEMGVDPQIIDIMKRGSETQRRYELAPDDLRRLRVINNAR